MMKRALLSILLVAVFSGSFAQKADTPKEATNIDSLLKQGAVLVIDGQVITERPPKFKPDSILFITILERDKTKEMFEGDARNGVIVIVTRQTAIAAYEKKLGRLCESYKKYIATQGDYDISYVLMNTKGQLDALAKNRDDLTRRLYEIPEDKIEGVSFSVKETCCGVNRICIINIKD